MTQDSGSPGKTAYADAAQIRSVQRAIALLRALASKPRGAAVSELALQLGMPKSSVYRLLVTLRRSNWVAFDSDSERYHLGIGLLEVSAGVLDRLDLREIARPHLLAIVRECDESVHLGLLNDTNVIYALKFESTQSIRMVSEVGRLAPLYCTGLGKAMLAWMPEGERESLLGRIELRRFTDTTLTNPGALRENLAEARVRGYAIDEGEHEDFVRCVAAPLIGPQGLVGAMSITAPAFRISDARVAELGLLISTHCAQISAQLERTAPWRAEA